MNQSTPCPTAVRFGRMPKTEREKLMADKEELSSSNSKRIVELRSLTDLIKAAFRDVFHNTILFAGQPDSAANLSPTASSASVSSFAGVGVGVAGCSGGGGGGGGVGVFPAHATVSSSSSSSTSPFDTSVSFFGRVLDLSFL